MTIVSMLSCERKSSSITRTFRPNLDRSPSVAARFGARVAVKTRSNPSRASASALAAPTP